MNKLAFSSLITLSLMLSACDQSTETATEKTTSPTVQIGKEAIPTDEMLEHSTETIEQTTGELIEKVDEMMENANDVMEEASEKLE